jgi:hypothetical protein
LLRGIEVSDGIHIYVVATTSADFPHISFVFAVRCANFDMLREENKTSRMCVEVLSGKALM